MYFQGNFYVIDCHGALFICDLEDRVAKPILPAIAGTRDSMEKYIVESGGELFLVARIRGRKDMYANTLWKYQTFEEGDDRREYFTADF